MKTPFSLALLAAVAMPGAALADYICKDLPRIPGSTYVQVFELNNGNQIAGGSDSGAVVYSAGHWTTLPAPPAASGYAQENLGALGINDAGDVAGEAFDPVTGHQQLMLYSGGAYSFTSPFDAWQSIQARAISNSGIMTGTASNDDSTAVGFVYNPQGRAPYAPGFTIVAPQVDGEDPWNVIAAQMNDAGQFVGGGFYPSTRPHAFSYDPATGQYTTYQINNWNTRARGLNNRGDVLTEALEPGVGVYHNYITDTAGNVKQEVSCPNVTQGESGLFMVGINDQGVISGESGDITTGTGMMAFPDAASALADLVLCTGGEGPGPALSLLAHDAQSAYAAGNLGRTCGALHAYSALVKGKKVDQYLGPSLLSESTAIAAALHCN